MSVRPGFARGLGVALGAAGRFAAGRGTDCVAGLDVGVSGSVRAGVSGEVVTAFEFVLELKGGAVMPTLEFASAAGSTAVSSIGEAAGVGSIEGAGDGDGSTMAALAM